MWTIEALPEPMVRAIRETGTDERSVPARRVTAVDPRYPCRRCLREAAFMSEVLLVSINPFATDSPYAQRSPAFVCVRCAHDEPAASMPEIVTTRRVNLRAFGAAETMLYPHSQVVDGADASAALDRMFADTAVEKVHIHTALHGCYLCRAVRT